MRQIAILGSTGSIGQSALAVVATHADRLRVVAMAAGENIARFVEQVDRFVPDTIAMSTPRAATTFSPKGNTIAGWTCIELRRLPTTPNSWKRSTDVVEFS